MIYLLFKNIVYLLLFHNFFEIQINIFYFENYDLLSQIKKNS